MSHVIHASIATTNPINEKRRSANKKDQRVEMDHLNLQDWNINLHRFISTGVPSSFKVCLNCQKFTCKTKCCFAKNAKLGKGSGKPDQPQPRQKGKSEHEELPGQCNILGPYFPARSMVNVVLDHSARQNRLSKPKSNRKRGIHYLRIGNWTWRANGTPLRPDKKVKIRDFATTTGAMNTNLKT